MTQQNSLSDAELAVIQNCHKILTNINNVLRRHPEKAHEEPYQRIHGLLSGEHKPDDLTKGEDDVTEKGNPDAFSLDAILKRHAQGQSQV